MSMPKLDRLGLYLSESFAEISAASSKSDRPPISKFWYLRSKNLLDGLKEFFEQKNIGDASQLRVSSFWPEMIVQRSLGTPPALLVSAGFEDWLHLRQPKKGFSLPPERFRSFFSSDFIFGITERTDAEGKVRSTPSEEELEFLHQKFLLSSTKNIAIGFLHSSKNSSNEAQVAKFFRDREYKVWVSHEQPADLNEVARWWRTGLEAYIHNTLEEMNQPLIDFCKERGIRIVPKDFDSLAGSFEIFNRITKNYKKTDVDYVLWADLRSFTLLDLRNNQKVVETMWGPIAASTPRMKQLRLKPTSLIENEGIRGLRKNFFDISFDPGPMAFGRGIKPSFFDALYGFDYLDVSEEIKNLIAPASKDKIIQSLAISMRVLLKNESRWPEFLAGWMRTQLVTEIISFIETPNLVLMGPLSASLAKLFEDKELGFKLKVEAPTVNCASLATLSLASQE